MSETSKRGPPQVKRIPAWVQAEQRQYQRIRALTREEKIARLEAARWPDRAKQASAVARVQRTGWGGQ